MNERDLRAPRLWRITKAATWWDGIINSGHFFSVEIDEENEDCTISTYLGYGLSKTHIRQVLDAGTGVCITYWGGEAGKKLTALVELHSTLVDAIEASKSSQDHSFGVWKLGLYWREAERSEIERKREMEETQGKEAYHTRLAVYHTEQAGLYCLEGKTLKKMGEQGRSQLKLG